MSTSIRNFVRHFLEMVAAMVAGMVVLGLPAEAALRAAGTSTSQLQVDAPALVLLGMAFTMTVPMVAWMRHRGHDWRLLLEMAAAMFVPTFAVIGLMAAGILEDFGTLLAIEHEAMLVSMLAAMLLRRADYVHPAHAHGPRPAMTAGGFR